MILVPRFQSICVNLSVRDGMNTVLFGFGLGNKIKRYRHIV